MADMVMLLLGGFLRFFCVGDREFLSTGLDLWRWGEVVGFFKSSYPDLMI